MNSNQDSANEGFLGRSLCGFLMVLILEYIIYLLMATKYIYQNTSTKIHNWVLSSGPGIYL